jgi:hypothetical protein
MNNPLAQKAQYYLNESNRLSEELKLEREYRELLENILIGSLTEEQVCQIKEGLMKKLGAAALAGSCLLGTACGKVAPQAHSGAGVEGKLPGITHVEKGGQKSTKAAPKAKASAKIPGAGVEGEL